MGGRPRRDRFGPVAPQVAMDISLAGVQRSQNPDGTAKYRGGEDCLVLNVWTPALDDTKRPVMVWLHGGGFTFAEGTSPGGVTSGHVIARTKDVVSISLNHRLGVLGYLHLGDVLGDDYAVSGVVGQLDLVLALEWIRDNVAAFGGDRDQDREGRR